MGAQYKDRGFSAGERAAARRAYAAWFARLETAPPPSDRAADALEPECEWNGYIDAISGYMNGETLDRISAVDMLAYDEAATDFELARAGRLRDADRGELSPPGPTCGSPRPSRRSRSPAGRCR